MIWLCGRELVKTQTKLINMSRNLYFAIFFLPYYLVKAWHIYKGTVGLFQGIFILIFEASTKRLLVVADASTIASKF